MKKKLYEFFILIFILGSLAGVNGQENKMDVYTLQAGDVISIQVVEHPEFSGRHKIRPDGKINYPVIGELDIAGLTCPQLVKIMESKLTSYVNNPIVSVSIEAYYANKIFVTGSVKRSGEYEIYEPINVIKAIAMCGGLAKENVKDIKIIRADGSIETVDAEKLYSQGGSQYLLYPGDTVYVPEGFEMPWGLISTVLGVLSVTLTIILNINRLSSD